MHGGYSVSPAPPSPFSPGWDGQPWGLDSTVTSITCKQASLVRCLWGGGVTAGPPGPPSVTCSRKYAGWSQLLCLPTWQELGKAFSFFPPIPFRTS